MKCSKKLHCYTEHKFVLYQVQWHRGLAEVVEWRQFEHGPWKNTNRFDELFARSRWLLITFSTLTVMVTIHYGLLSWWCVAGHCNDCSVYFQHPTRLLQHLAHLFCSKHVTLSMPKNPKETFWGLCEHDILLTMLPNQHCQWIKKVFIANLKSFVLSGCYMCDCDAYIEIMYCYCLHLQQIAELQKENFSLKLRIYFLEERMKKDGIPSEDVYNIVRTFV